jgi:outer membrane protein assembly factor BamE (lipoprotein component of BamABCDE complex)
MKKMMQSLAVVLGAMTLAGCTTVKPWERAMLADYTMRPDRDPLGNLLAEHMWFSREAASGGRSVGGGGCGCN